jgi:hypothetical protein
MLDQNDRHALLAKFADSPIKISNFLLIHSSGWLIEKQQTWLGRSSASELQATLLSKSEVRREFIALIR